MNYRLTIPVMHCFDDRYAAPAAVAFLSMLEHGAKDCFFALYVVHVDISEKHQAMLEEIVDRFENASLEFLSPDSHIGELFDNLKFKGHFSKEMFFKLLAPKIFPQYDRIMIADVDVCYQDDIAQMYQKFLEDENLVVGHNPGEARIAFGKKYEELSYGEFSIKERETLQKGVNACYMIFNLRRMRMEMVDKLFDECAMRNISRLKQPEQDVINLVCADRISYLPLRAVACTYLWSVLTEGEKPLWREAMEHPVQIHYSLPEKPWNYPANPMAHLWWGTLARTPFFYETAERLDVAPRKTNFSFFGKIPLFEVWHRGLVSRVRVGGIVPLRKAKSFWK